MEKQNADLESLLSGRLYAGTLSGGVPTDDMAKGMEVFEQAERQCGGDRGHLELSRWEPNSLKA